MFNKFLPILFLLIATSASAAVVKVQKSHDGWRLLVDDKPFFVKGICYTANTIPEDAHDNTLRDWMEIDDDKDGRNDLAYQSWVDTNRNDKQDEDEPDIGDFQLLKDMGVNTLRIYHHPSADPELVKINHGQILVSHAPNKELLRAMYRDHGIWVMMGDLIGAYTVGSGADWDKGADYTDPVQRANMMKSVETMVSDFKDEPYILMWALGNENNIAEFTQNNSQQFPKEYAIFVNTIAKRIHKLDPNHPVVLVNGETMNIEFYKKYAPDVDILGLNTYRSFQGFNTLWKEVEGKYGKPVVLTEYGTGYPPVIPGTLTIDEDRQAKIHYDAWMDIAEHAAGKTAPGNCIGAFAFEWTDNWWQNYKPAEHNRAPDGKGWDYEFNGIAGQGDGTKSPRIRQLRKVYDMYKRSWNEGTP